MTFLDRSISHKVMIFVIIIKWIISTEAILKRWYHAHQTFSQRQNDIYRNKNLFNTNIIISKNLFAFEIFTPNKISERKIIKPKNKKFFIFTNRYVDRRSLTIIYIFLWKYVVVDLYFASIENDEDVDEEDEDEKKMKTKKTVLFRFVDEEFVE